MWSARPQKVCFDTRTVMAMPLKRKMHVESRRKTRWQIAEADMSLYEWDMDLGTVLLLPKKEEIPAVEWQSLWVSLSDEQSVLHFRFEKHMILEMLGLLRVPEIIDLQNR